MLAQLLCSDYHGNARPPRCSLKLDIYKAFDSLHWDFLFFALQRMGFSQVLISWTNACLCSAIVFIKINSAL